MRSYIIRSSDRKRVAEFAKKQTEEMQQAYIKLVLKLTALELKRRTSLGKTALQRCCI